MSDLKTSDLIRATLRLAQGSQRSPVNQLAALKDDTATTATFEFPIPGLQVGSTVEIGWVEYSVVDVNPDAKTIEVLPVIEGSAVDHAAGSRVTIRPRFPARRIIEELNNDLMDLSAQGLYRLRSVDAVNGKVVPPVDAVVILEAWSTDSPTSRQPGNRWRLSDTPTGSVLIGEQNLDYMVFGCTLGQLSLSTDQDITSTGLVSTCEDIPPLGAALRLLAGLEAQRNLADSQGETRRATEVQSGAMTGALRNLAALRQARVQAEAARLQQRYGFKVRLAM